MQDEIESALSAGLERLVYYATGVPPGADLDVANIEIAAASAIVANAAALLALYLPPIGAMSPTSKAATVIRTPKSQWQITSVSQE